MSGDPLYRWENLGTSSLLTEESVALGLRSCCFSLLGLPSFPSHPCSYAMSGALLVLRSPGWEGLTSWRMQARSHPAVPRSRRDPGPGGELSSQLQGEVRTGSCLSQRGAGGRPLPGLLMDQMQSCRLGSVQACRLRAARRRVGGPGRKDARQGVVGWLARLLPPRDLWCCP